MQLQRRQNVGLPSLRGQTQEIHPERSPETIRKDTIVEEEESGDNTPHVLSEHPQTEISSFHRLAAKEVNFELDQVDAELSDAGSHSKQASERNFYASGKELFLSTHPSGVGLPHAGQLKTPEPNKAGSQNNRERSPMSVGMDVIGLKQSYQTQKKVKMILAEMSKLEGSKIRNKVLELIARLKMLQNPPEDWKQMVSRQGGLNYQEEQNESKLSGMDELEMNKLEAQKFKEFNQILERDAGPKRLRMFTRWGPKPIEIFPSMKHPEIWRVRFEHWGEEHFQVLNIYELFETNGILLSENVCLRGHKMWAWSIVPAEDAYLERLNMKAGDLQAFRDDDGGGGGGGYDRAARLSPQSLSTSRVAAQAGRPTRRNFKRQGMLLKKGKFERFFYFYSAQDRSRFLAGLRVFLRALIRRDKKVVGQKPIEFAFETPNLKGKQEFKYSNYDPQIMFFKSQAQEIKNQSQISDIRIAMVDGEISVHFNIIKSEKHCHKVFLNHENILFEVTQYLKEAQLLAPDYQLLFTTLAQFIIANWIKPLQYRSIKAKVDRWLMLCQGNQGMGQLEVDNFEEEGYINSQKENFYNFSEKRPRRLSERSDTSMSRFKTPQMTAHNLLAMPSNFNDMEVQRDTLVKDVDVFLRQLHKNLADRNSYSNVSPLTFTKRIKEEHRQFRRKNKRRGKRLKAQNTVRKLQKQQTLGIKRFKTERIPQRESSFNNFKKLLTAKRIKPETESNNQFQQYMAQSIQSLPRRTSSNKISRKFKFASLKENHESRLSQSRAREEPVLNMQDPLYIPPPKKRDEFCHYCDIF